MQPLSKAAVENAGESYARNPVGVGPYRLKEWQTGNKIVLERNPDYEWGPGYMHRGPYYIQEIEYRNIPEESTVLAGLEAGEVDIATIKAKDVSRLRASGRLQIFEGMRMGVPVSLVMNLEKPPFDDLRVRKALNLAVDRETLANIVLQGTAVPEYGPMARPMIGYWSGVEEIGYGYDVAQAKALLADAGFTAGGSGMLEKDGKPFRFPLLVTTADPTFVKVSEVLKESYKAIGVDVEIRVQEDKLVIADMVEGKYEVSVLDFNYPEADCLFMLFHSSMIGAINMGHTKDAEMDELLLSTRTTMDPVKRQEALIAVQRRAIEQAYLVPIYTPKTYLAVSNRVKGAVFSPLTAGMYYIHLGDAYIEE
jgi:peptide/nickel transport system substrate-binding protein